MKQVTFLLFYLVFGAHAFAQATAAWMMTAIFYQVYPSSFQDSDGNGIGDLKGIESRLDYIQSLGVNTIWLNPIFKSGFKDGGYDVIDFYQVDPRFGTNTDLKDLATELHRRNMHLVLDLVAGHSSNENEWFKQSMQADVNQRYSDYYIWASTKPSDLAEQEASHWVESDAPRAKYYIKNYYDIQPALNYGYAHPNPSRPWEKAVDAPGPQAVRRELKNVMAFWMDKGVDGFRVDLASSLVKNDQDKSATIALWKDVSGWFHQQFPQGVLVAEWFNPKQSIAAGFDMDFLRPGKLTSAYERGKKTDAKVYFDKAGAGILADWESYFNDQHGSTVGRGYVSVPTGSHDAPRMANDDRSDKRELEVLLTFFLTQPGVPLIYYGDEIGMKYIPNSPDVEGSRNRSGSRSPMQWDGSEDAGFSTAAKDKIYIPLDPSPDRPTVEKEEKDPESQLNYVRGLLKLRASASALGNDGGLDFLGDPAQPYPMVYIRYAGDQKYLVVLNPTGKSVEAKLATQHAHGATYVLGTDKSAVYECGRTEDTITLPAVSAAIFRLDR